MQTMTDETLQKKLKTVQKTEITEHLIYRKLSRSTKDSHNSETLLNISRDEMKHYAVWKKHTGQDERPDMIKVWLYYLVSKILGLTFGIKLMEKGEGKAQRTYVDISAHIPEALDIAKEEDEHEAQLVRMINEERLNYVGSVIRGLNDALVELTGALAGFTLALREPRLIAMVGLITGIAASLSMAGTEYLARKSEKTALAPLKSALYTGCAYVLTVLFLIFPYLLFTNVYFSLALMIINAIVVIVLFNFYMSVAKDQPFWKEFSSMAALSLGIAALSFGIGFVLRHFVGI
jgi:VIT1/CCC1 family predicted Fe2+/Mn2+ transporter